VDGSWQVPFQAVAAADGQHDIFVKLTARALRCTIEVGIERFTDMDISSLQFNGIEI